MNTCLAHSKWKGRGVPRGTQGKAALHWPLHAELTAGLEGSSQELEGHLWGNRGQADGKQGWKSLLQVREELISVLSLHPLPMCMELSPTFFAPTPDNCGSPQCTSMCSTSPGPSGSISTEGLTSVRGWELGSSHLPGIWVGRNSCRLPWSSWFREGHWLGDREEQRG